MATILTSTTFNNDEFYGGFRYSSSFLEKSEFKRKNTNEKPSINPSDNIPENDEISGGYPLRNLYNQTMKGGNRQIEGLSQITHLSVPLGLVVCSYKYVKPYDNDEEPIETINDEDFNQLYDMNVYNKKRNNKTKKNKIVFKSENSESMKKNKTHKKQSKNE